MKLSKFLPVFIAAMVIGFGGFVLAGDAFAGCVSGAYGEPCLPDRPSRTPPIFKPPPTYVPTTPSPQELERQRKERERQREANDLNKRGVEYYKKGHWATAVDYFSRALKLYPDSVIRQNLLNAEKEVERVAAERERDRELDELQEQEEKLADEAAKKAKEKIHQRLDDFSAELGSSHAPKGPLTLMGPRKPLFARGAKASSPGGLQFMDPRQEEQTTSLKVHGEWREFALPNKPTIPKGSSGITDASAQLKSAAKTGKWAKEVGPTRKMDFIRDEKASGRAGIGFDTPGFKEGRLEIDDSAPPVKGAPVMVEVAGVKIPKLLENDKKVKRLGQRYETLERGYQELEKERRELEKDLAEVRDQRSRSDAKTAPGLNMREYKIKAKLSRVDYNQGLIHKEQGKVQEEMNSYNIKMGSDEQEVPEKSDNLGEASGKDNKGGTNESSSQ